MLITVWVSCSNCFVQSVHYSRNLLASDPDAIQAQRKYQHWNAPAKLENPFMLVAPAIMQYNISQRFTRRWVLKAVSWENVPRDVEAQKGTSAKEEERGPHQEGVDDHNRFHCRFPGLAKERYLMHFSYVNVLLQQRFLYLVTDVAPNGR